MTLKKGDRAPNFSIVDSKQEVQSIEKYLGKKVMLSFYRYAGCPVCNLNLHKIISHYEHFSSRGLNILAFFQSTQEKLNDETPTKQQPSFPLIPDSEKKVYSLYGVESSIVGLAKSALDIPQWITANAQFKQGAFEGDMLLLPAQFLINKQGIIEYAHYAVSIGDFTPFLKIEEFLDFGE
ncbi:MAG: AhpC/TSA family protein [bacterium]|nr:AhpC/TSA family protein [bacterium]